MQYLTPRNMSSLVTPKIHKMNSNSTDTPWMQSSVTADQYYNSTNLPASHSSDAIMTDADADNLYMSDNTSKHSNRSRNSTSDMCVEKNTEGKPPYSYATLIKYAIERSSENKLTLSQIYQWVIEHYPYYGSAGSGWKNSIRHNLSLNKSFVRVPRPVNEPGKGSYWTVDQFAIDTEQRLRSTVRGRSSRSSSDTSLHSHRANSDSWLRNCRDSRSLSTDAGVSSSINSSAAATAAAARRTSQFGYCSHPYAGYERNNFNHHQYGYPSYHYYQQQQQQQQHQQRMPSHEALLNARQHSSVTYSLPANANTKNHHPSFMNNSMYSMHQQPFYSHRQSCPDLTSISSGFSETNMLPNFNTAGASATNELETSSTCDNKTMYSTPQPYYTNPNMGDTQKILGSFVPSSSCSPIKGNARSNSNNNDPTLSSFFKEFDTPTSKDNSHHLPGLPSPVLSSSNCSSTSPSSSSQHLSVADPLSMVTRHPSPVTTTTTTTSATPANRLTSPYYSSTANTTDLMMDSHGLKAPSSKEECLTSPSSPLVMTDTSVAYMVSQQHTRNEDSLVSNSSSTVSSQHEACSPQPSTNGDGNTFNYGSQQQDRSPQPSIKYSNSFFQQQQHHQNEDLVSPNGRFDYANL